VDEALGKALRNIEGAESDNTQEGAAAQVGLGGLSERHSFGTLEIYLNKSAG
jgi:hypothetical protein